MLAIVLGKDANPMKISGKNLEATLKRLPNWHELFADTAAQWAWVPILSATPTPQMHAACAT